MEKTEAIKSLMSVVDTLYDYIQNKLSTEDEIGQKKIANFILRNFRYQK